LVGEHFALLKVDYRSLSRLMSTFLASLHEFNLQGPAAVHALRGLRSLVHGFVSLESSGALKHPVDRNESFSWLVNPSPNSTSICSDDTPARRIYCALRCEVDTDKQDSNVVWNEQPRFSIKSQPLAVWSKMRPTGRFTLNLAATDLGDVADLAGQVRGHRVDVVGEVLPGQFFKEPALLI
jgi:hypothetical protein